MNKKIVRKILAVMLMAVIMSTTVMAAAGEETQAATTTTLSKTSGVSVSVKSTSSVKISWTKVSGASGYQIYRKTGSGSWEKIKTVKSGSTTSYTNTGLKTGKTYTYKVRAYKKKSSGNIYGSFSSTKKVTGGTPAKVTGLSASASAGGKIKLTWTKVSGADGYQIYRKTSGGSWKKVKTITSGSTVTYTNTGTAGKTYYYKVRAYNKGGSSTYTGSFSSSVSKKAVTVGKVTGLSASASAGGKIKLTWTKVSGASGYQVYRKTGSSGTWKKVKTITSGSTVKYTDTGTSGKTYYYKVRAYYKSGSSTYKGSFSSSVSKKAVAVGKVTGLSAAASAGGKIKLTWTKVSGASGYQIYRKTSGGSWKKVKTVTSGSTVAYTDTGTPGTTYYYKVRAYYKNGSSTYKGSFSSSVSKEAISVGKVTGLSANATIAGGIELAWTKVTGADGYQIYRKTGSSGTWEKIKTTTSGSTVKYTDTGTSGKTYYYKVRAYYKSGSSTYTGSFSSSVSKTAVEIKAVTDLSATVKSECEVKLSWTELDYVDTYYIYVIEEGSDTRTLIGCIEDSGTYTYSGLSAGTTYTFVIVTYKYWAGNTYYSGDSNSVTVTTEGEKVHTHDWEPTGTYDMFNYTVEYECTECGKVETFDIVFDTSTAAEAIETINEYRAAAGLSEYIVDSSLTTLAMARATECFVSFSHERPDGTSHSYTWADLGLAETSSVVALGECLAKNGNAVYMWKGSAGHWAVIMDEEKSYIAIACAYCDGSDDYIWVLETGYCVED